MRKRRLSGNYAKILHATMMILTLFLPVACNLQRSPSPAANTTSPMGKNPASIHVGFISETTNMNFAREMAAGAQYAAEQYHVSAQIVAPSTFQSSATFDLFKHLLQTARDGIAVETLAPELFVQTEANAIRQGIPLVAVDTPPLPGSHITSFVGNDNIEAGQMLADAAIKRIPTNARGDILLGVDNLGASVLLARAQGVRQEFRRLRPALQIVGPFDSRQPRRQNLTAWIDTITSHAAVVACLGVGDADNASLAQIKQDKHGAYLSGAFDLDPTALQAIANGTNFALVDPQHFLKGYVAMRLLIEHALYGSALPQGWWNPGALLVNQKNIQLIIRRQMSLAAKGRFFQPEIDQQFANPAARIKPLNQVR